MHHHEAARAEIDERLSDEDPLDLMATVINDNLLDLCAMSRVLCGLYEDRRPDAIRKQMARNSMLVRAQRLGDSDFDALWRQHLVDVEHLAKQIEEVQLAIGASKVGRLLGIACDELASRPRAMRMRPMRRLLWRASKVNQPPSR